MAKLVDTSTDTEFLAVLGSSETWAEAYTRLGYKGNPGGSTRARLRGRAKSLGFDWSAFNREPGPDRTWDDSELRQAVAEEPHWTAVVSRLHSSYAAARRSAERIGLDVGHLDRANHMMPHSEGTARLEFDQKRLSEAAESLAAAWYTLRGYEVFVPSPGSKSAADLLIARNNKVTGYVQVKSTTSRKGQGWSVRLTRSDGRGRCKPYTSGEVTEFFIVSLDGVMYRIPFEVIPESGGIILGKKYAAFEVHLFDD